MTHNLDKKLEEKEIFDISVRFRIYFDDHYHQNDWCIWGLKHKVGVAIPEREVINLESPKEMGEKRREIIENTLELLMDVHNKYTKLFEDAVASDEEFMRKQESEDWAINLKSDMSYKKKYDLIEELYKAIIAEKGECLATKRYINKGNSMKENYL